MALPLVRYIFEDENWHVTKEPLSTAPGISASTFDSNDAGGLATTGTSGYAIFDNGWGISDESHWFSFTVTPGEGTIATVDSLSFDHLASATGPVSWKVRTSLDSFASNAGSGSTGLPGEWHSVSIPIPVIISSPLEVRLYGQGASQDSGTWKLDNVELSGVVVFSGISSSSSSLSTSSSPSSSTVMLTSSSSVSESSSSHSSHSSDSSSVEDAKSSSSSSSSSFESGKSSSSSVSSPSSDLSTSSSSSSSSSSSYLHRWLATAIDVDEATGEAYVAVNRLGGPSYIMRVDPSNTVVLDKCRMQSGFSLNSIYVDQGVDGFLPFRFEVLESRKAPASLGFSFTGVTADTGNFKGLVDLSPTASIAEVSHDSSVDVFVWGRGISGLKSTRQGAGRTFDAAWYDDPVTPIRLPVFNWSSTSMRQIPSIVVAMADGSYSIVDCDPSLLRGDVRGAGFSTKEFPSNSVPLGGKTATSMAVNPAGQTIFLANDFAVAAVDAGTFSPVASVEPGEGGVGGGGADGLAVHAFLPSGEILGRSKLDGKLFTTMKVVLHSSSSSEPVEWRSSSSSSKSSRSSQSSSSSSSSSSINSSSSSSSSSKSSKSSPSSFSSSSSSSSKSSLSSRSSGSSFSSSSSESSSSSSSSSTSSSSSSSSSSSRNSSSSTSYGGIWAHWKLNENDRANDVLDYSPNGRHGALLAATPAYTMNFHLSSILGGQFVFDYNTEQRIQVSLQHFPAGNLTICAWITPDNWGGPDTGTPGKGHGRIIDDTKVSGGVRTGGVEFYVEGDAIPAADPPLGSTGRIRFSSDNGTTKANSTFALSRGARTFVCVVRHDTTLCDFYINGSADNINQTCAVTPTLGQNIHIANRVRDDGNGYDRVFGGKIDNIMVVDRALTAGEILCLYNGGAGTEDITCL